MPNREFSIFIDRNSGGKAFREKLILGWIKAVLHDDIFDQDTPDDEWLKKVAELGYVVVTGDKRTLRDPMFLKHLSECNVFVFVLYGLNTGGTTDRASVILGAYSKIKEIVNSHSGPMLWTISKDNRECRLCDYKKVIHKMHRHRRH